MNNGLDGSLCWDAGSPGLWVFVEVLDSCLVFGGAAENTVCSVIRWKLNTATILSARPWSNRVKVVELYHPGKLAKPAI